MNIYEKLLNIQSELKAPKGQTNKFGGYKYRSCEDILEAVKPLLEANKCILILSDEIKEVGYEEQSRFYVEATASLIDCEDEHNIAIRNTAYARESKEKKGMDDSQITGTASSYARKYALNGLFCIDDTKDADTDEFKKQQGEEIPKLTNEEIKILETTQKKYKVSDEKAKEILIKYGYPSYQEVLKSDYAKIGNELSKGGK